MLQRAIVLNLPHYGEVSLHMSDCHFYHNCRMLQHTIKNYLDVKGELSYEHKWSLKYRFWMNALLEKGLVVCAHDCRESIEVRREKVRKNTLCLQEQMGQRKGIVVDYGLGEGIVVVEGISVGREVKRDLVDGCGGDSDLVCAEEDLRKVGEFGPVENHVRGGVSLV